MCLHGLEFRRTPDLEALAGLLRDVGVVPPADELDLRRLKPYAVEFRYDDEAIHLISGETAGRLIGLLFDWAEKEIASHRDSR